MKLIIDISEGDYKWIKDHVMTVNEQRIANGIPLDELLDKIRAEIEQKSNINNKYYYKQELWDVLEIIDKYRGDADEMS